ncbi:hypothetical protein QRN89_34965 [Streptomyces chengbuensis]|uniref:hypothetical protein n=1 Tax=Streptomyces TaxID=1883 RepID=UPI0025B4BFD3|nr:hypothetical protein [Streptomyces sp. HUAS CB01]WJY54538.1 hypothetical protein QRN89_34965 [Streptomyces sp. HUAS CB01]
MSYIPRRTGAIAVGASLTLSLLVVGAPSATADTNCGSWPGNGIAHHDVKTRTVTHGGRTVKIALVNQRLSDHSFAAIRSGYRSGDQTWVDRSTDGGKNWTQCGPFNRQFSNDLNNLHYSMRACARFNGASFCTGWYYDND